MLIFLHQFYCFMEQTQACSNCNKAIPISKSATHFGYCRRNIIKCSTCGEMYDKNFLEDHEEEFHSTSKCIHCAKMLKKNEVEQHTSTCLMKPKFCQYCDLNVPAKDFIAHFKQCESRTSQCTLCQKSIVNKEFAIHQATCKGKSKVQPAKDQFQFDSVSNKYNFDDSLNQFWQQNDKEKDKKAKKVQEKESPVKKESKRQSATNNTAGKKQVEVKPDFKKQSIDPKALSRQHFYDNYLNPSQSLQEYNDFDFEQNFGQLNFEDSNSYDYLPQQSFYGKSAFDFQTPSTFEYVNHQGEQLEADEQLMQQTLFESSKRNQGDRYKQNLPSDFFSEDIMNQSFYKDILDLEKQKAILEDLGKNKVKNTSTAPKPKVEPLPKVTKPTSKLPLKNDKKK